MNSHILDYYRQHSPITDPGAYGHLYRDLPAGIPALVRLIQGQMLHAKAAEHYGLTLTRGSREEVYLRSMAQRLERIAALSPEPLTIAREPRDRQVGKCRDFAVFLVSLLRHQGIPARMRVGFAEYLFVDQPYKADHWITEYWDSAEQRWILADPDVGGLENKELLPTHCNLFDLRRDQDFFLAGSAWQLARSGRLSSTLFRYSGRWKGFPCIRGNLLHDFQALNRLELAVFDYWDDLHIKPESSLTVEDKTLLDCIAELTVNVDDRFEELRATFDSLPRTQRILAKLRQLGLMAGMPQASSPGLQPSGMEQLSTRTAWKPDEAVFSLPPRFNPPDEDETPFETTALPSPVQASGELSDIFIRGARQHNLKHINVRIPRNRLVVITGVSGSGKSSLAFDTIYAEGQRRYVESLSSFARQFMDQMEKPQVDQITGLSPAIAIEQKTIARNPRSTVGTVTEILDYLRVLYARLGMAHCPQCGRAVQAQSAQQISNQLACLQPGTRFELLAPLARNRKGTFATVLKQATKDGYVRARIDGATIDLTTGVPELDKDKKHHLELSIDRLVVPDGKDHADGIKEFRTRLMDSVETSLRAGGGNLIVLIYPHPQPLSRLARGAEPHPAPSPEEGGAQMPPFTPEEEAQEIEEILLSEHNACPHCEISFPRLEPHLFSFNSPLGMCDECNGLGVKMQVDPALIIEHPERSLLDGASRWYRDLRQKGEGAWQVRSLMSIADHYGVNLELPWNELPESFRQVILHGSGGEKVHFEFNVENEEGVWRGESVRDVKGVIHNVNRLFRQTRSEYTRRYYMSFMSQLPCPKCNGERLNPEARFVTIDGRRLPELTSWSIEAIHTWISNLEEKLDEEQREIGLELISEIHQRLGFLRNVGLHYLTLDRPAPTLSGGEGQRIRLASQIGSGLVGVLYILDEPSIGLHSRDQRALLDTLCHLRDIGNTVLVVEHDAATMKTADWIIDLGPGPGILGGELVAAGTPEEIMLNADSLTGKYLSGELVVNAPNGHQRRASKGSLTIRGARLHNLKKISVSFPLGNLICVTGVSGSGKSSLIAQTLYPALTRALHRAQSTPGPHDSLEGLELVDKIINITQEPIGRNPRSNPGTYAGVLDDIRKVFASTPEAKALGFGAARFSFNVKGGRCEECQGYGSKRVEMHFLPDVWVKCKACEGKRFNRQTLDITYKGKTIADVLDMDVQEALSFFENHRDIRRILKTLDDVGLDYLKLGQSALTLSGGEAQRVKLAKELSRAATGDTIYLLDEPTTGLHFADIQKLLDVLHRLTDAGNTVIVIEHNLDVIRTADWIIDLGPEGGEKGGYIVAEGTPEEVAQMQASFTGQFLGQVM